MENFPIEFDISLYKDYNEHLRSFSDIELINHFNFYGIHEGLKCSSINNRTDFFSLIDQNLPVLEIGPLCFPLITNCVTRKSLDYFTTEELKENYKNDPNVNIDNIVHVDYVVKDIKLYTDVITPKSFNYCCSSHNIEHTPCLISFLNNISDVLKDNGYLFLAIPDCRYCFDRFRNYSSIFDVLNRYYNNIKIHPAVSLLENKYIHTHNFSESHWTDKERSFQNLFAEINEQNNFLLSKKNDIINDIEKIKSTFENNSEYIDCHSWTFTPFTFKFILDILYETKIINFKIVRLYRTLKGSNEFYAILQKM